MTNDDLKRFYPENAVPEMKKDFVRYNEDGTVTVTSSVTGSWSNVAVDQWVEDETYPDFPYKATIQLEGVTDQSICCVIFSQQDAESGNYSSVCQTVDGGVEIYSSVNTAIVIPLIFKL